MRALFSFIIFVFMSVAALAQDVSTLVNALALGNFKDREAAVTALATSRSDVTVPVLEALAAGNLHVRKADQKVWRSLVRWQKLIWKKSKSTMRCAK
jgi:urea transport system permease protein